MSAPASGGGGSGGPAAQAEQPSMLQQGLKMAAIFMVGQMVMNGVGKYMKGEPVFGPSTTAPAIVPGGEQGASSATNPLEQAASGMSPPASLNPPNANTLWALGTPLSMYVYLSTETSYEDTTPSYTTDPIVAWDNLTYGNWKEHREVDLWLDIEESVQRNASMWADVVVVADGKKMSTEDVNKALKDSNKASVTRKLVTRYYPKKKIRKERNLMASKEEKEKDAAEAELEAVEAATTVQPVVSHWAANLSLTIVSDGSTLAYGRNQPIIREHINLEPTGMRDPKGDGYYYPVVFANDFWLLREDMYPINTTVTRLPLRITYDPISVLKFNIYASMTPAMDSPQPGPGGQKPASSAEMDEIKRMLITANPYGLMLTAVVTVLHMLFEFLAFSSDVSHWRKKDKDLVGVSLRSIITNVVVQLVIMLYLYDSSEDTSFMILASQGFSLVIEIWKITKVVDIKIKPAQGLIPYAISFEDKKQLSEDELKSQEYDKLAFKIVGYAAIPLLIGYTIYSLKYHSYKGWYSFIISTLAQAIYMFGFAQLVPQLIINYKLKSVAHLPMKAMIYKTLTTFVDDCFAFSVKMPMLHRLATLRDDVVFFILLYQYYIYKVDPKRANEYGQVLEGSTVGATDETEKKSLKKRFKSE